MHAVVPLAAAAAGCVEEKEEDLGKGATATLAPLHLTWWLFQELEIVAKEARFCVRRVCTSKRETAVPSVY